MIVTVIFLNNWRDDDAMLGLLDNTILSKQDKNEFRRNFIKKNYNLFIL